LARHSTQIGLSLENLAFTFSTKDPYKCSSHNARLHAGHAPPFPALKKILHLSHCQLNVDWRKNGGTYTIAKVWDPLHDALGLSSTGEPICAASTHTILM
jgi:hypothetical protein